MVAAPPFLQNDPFLNVSYAQVGQNRTADSQQPQHTSDRLPPFSGYGSSRYDGRPQTAVPPDSGHHTRQRATVAYQPHPVAFGLDNCLSAYSPSDLRQPQYQTLPSDAIQPASSGLPVVQTANRQESDGSDHSGKCSDGDTRSNIKKKRKRADQQQLRVLHATFERTAFPTTDERNALAMQLGMTPRSVQIW